MGLLLLMGLAHAAPQVSLYVDVPVRTPPVQVETYGAQPGSAPPLSNRFRPPDRYHLYGGLAAQVVLRDEDPERWLLDLGVRAWKAEWSREPSDFVPSVWEARAGIAWRGLHWRGDSGFSAYVTAGVGGQVSVFEPRFWKLHVNPAANTFAGFGLRSGGDLKFVTEVRAAAALRVDHYDGTASVTEGTLHWRYRPGGLSASALVGIQF